MTVLPKTARPSHADEKRAYQIATYRDGGGIIEGGICQKCLRDCGPVARDHRQNRRVGNTVPSNIQCLGLRCHQWKTEHPDEANYDGWGCPSWAVPAEWPAHRWLPTKQGALRLAWVLLDDLGGWVEITAAEAAVRMGADA